MSRHRILFTMLLVVALGITARALVVPHLESVLRRSVSTIAASRGLVATARRIDVHLFERSLVITDFDLRPIHGDATFTLSAHELKATVELGSLLLGDPVISELRVDSPHIHLVEPTPTGSARNADRLAVHGVVITNGTLEYERGGAPGTQPFRMQVEHIWYRSPNVDASSLSSATLEATLSCTIVLDGVNTRLNRTCRATGCSTQIRGLPLRSIARSSRRLAMMGIVDGTLDVNIANDAEHELWDVTVHGMRTRLGSTPSPEDRPASELYDLASRLRLRTGRDLSLHFERSPHSLEMSDDLATTIGWAAEQLFNAFFGGR